jgi:hypothetical protein
MIDDAQTNPDVLYAVYQYNLNIILNEADNQGNASPTGALAAAGPTPISGQTIASGGGGNVGGGPGGDGGDERQKCVEVGTPVTIPAGATVTEKLIEQDDWVAVKVRGDEPVLMTPNTLVAIWVQARHLKGGEYADVGDNGEIEQITSAVRLVRKSQKVARVVNPHHWYRARRLRLHNLKMVDQNEFT